MGVYIKGMEMPKNCCECWFMEGADEWCCAHRGRYLEPDYRIAIKDKPDWCPLVEVPPHGRLTDADALAKDLEYDVELDSRILDDMDFVGKEREHIQFDKDCKQKCMRYLTEAPTIIPAGEEG